MNKIYDYFSITVYVFVINLTVPPVLYRPFPHSNKCLVTVLCAGMYASRYHFESSKGQAVHSKQSSANRQAVSEFNKRERALSSEMVSARQMSLSVFVSLQYLRAVLSAVTGVDRTAKRSGRVKARRECAVARSPTRGACGCR